MSGATWAEKIVAELNTTYHLIKLREGNFLLGPWRRHIVAEGEVFEHLETGQRIANTAVDVMVREP